MESVISHSRSKCGKITVKLSKQLYMRTNSYNEAKKLETV